MKRLFFATVLSDDAAREAHAVADALANRAGGENRVRWVDPKNYHVTLRFLGDTAVEQIDPLVAEVRSESASQQAFRASFGPLLLLPSARHTRVIALEVESGGQLEALAASVERGVCRAGATPSERPFRPHLTLGRSKGGRAIRGNALLKTSTSSQESFLVDAALLMESELSRDGARYRAIERIPLDASTSPHGHPV